MSYWRNVSDGYFQTAAVGALACSPSHPNVLYAGTGETSIRIDVSHGDGVYRSADGGQSWQHMGLSDTRFIGKIVVHPLNPDIVYVAALGNIYGNKNERGATVTPLRQRNLRPQPSAWHLSQRRWRKNLEASTLP